MEMAILLLLFMKIGNAHHNTSRRYWKKMKKEMVSRILTTFPPFFGSICFFDNGKFCGAESGILIRFGEGSAVSQSFEKLLPFLFFLHVEAFQTFAFSVLIKYNFRSETR